MQQPIPVVFNTVQQPSPRRPQGTPRQSTAKKSQQPAPMGTKHYCSTHLLSPHPFLRDPCGTVPQVTGIVIIPFPSAQTLHVTPPHGTPSTLCWFYCRAGTEGFVSGVSWKQCHSAVKMINQVAKKHLNPRDCWSPAGDWGGSEWEVWALISSFTAWESCGFV